MTAIQTSAQPQRSWLRPGIVLPTVVALVLVTLLITPLEERNSDSRLTTYSTGSSGARGVYDVLGQLGWHPSRQTTAWRAPLDTGAVYAILAPVRPLDDSEDSLLVQTVRAGGRVLLVSSDSALTASFRTQAVFLAAVPRSVEQTWAAGDSGGVIHREPPQAFGIDAATPFSMLQFAARPLPPLNDTLAIFLWGSFGRRDSATATAFAVGRRLGHGRVVVIADPVLLRNDVLREGHAALAVERAIEWLDPPSRRVIFDEYHQGYGFVDDGTHADPVAAIRRALTDTAAGRAGVQVIVASLILLLAIGARPLPPTPVPVIQRRSSLEHVGALARAYQQIHATQLGAQRLMLGLRRRHPLGGADNRQRVDDVTYLEMVRMRYNVSAQDMTTITQALAAEGDDEAFLTAGRAIGRLEHFITPQ